MSKIRELNCGSGTLLNWNDVEPIKFNPFTIEGDWKPIAEAWQKSEIKGS